VSAPAVPPAAAPAAAPASPPEEKLRELGLYPWFRVVEASDGPTVIIDGRRLVNLASNNYLALANDARLIDAATAAMRRWGIGVTGSRALNGNAAAGAELERRVAAFTGAEAAVLFPSGYHAMAGAVPIAARGCERIVHAARAHGSIADAARAASRETGTFDDFDALEPLLHGSRALVVVEGVSAADGRIAPLGEIAALCARHGHRLLIDDSHGFGVVGRRGRGTLDHSGVAIGEDVVLVTTLSKTLASNGGFAAGTRRLAEQLRNEATPLLYSVGLTPAAAAGAQAALDVLETDDALPARLAANVAAFAEGLQARGIPHRHHGTPVFTVAAGSDLRVLRTVAMLFERGVFSVPLTAAAATPAVRLSIIATHDGQQLGDALQALDETVTALRLREVRP
jgi:8-amino-7-oxononanoate synthase